MDVHSGVKRALELARSAKHVGSSLQSTVDIYIPTTAEGHYEAVLNVLERHADELADMFVVSGARINKPQGDDSSADFMFREEFEIQGIKASVEVRPPEHAKCPRCWRYVAPQEDALCSRCEDVVKT